MNTVGLPDTFFTEAPHWGWLIVFYFFVGGLAGGSYFVAALLDFFGGSDERRLARLGYYVALPAVIVSGILLIVDLYRPERFWHMMLQSETGWPMFKWWSPISFGAWALLVFGGFAFFSFLAALHEAGRLKWSWTWLFRPPGVIGSIWAALGAVFGLFIAGYTGILISVTNRPIWADSPLLGLVYLLSGASTAAALLILLAGARRLTAPSGHALQRFDASVLAVELVAVVALILSLWTVVPLVWFNWWGVLGLVGVVILGLLVPLALHARPRTRGALGMVSAAVLVLIGGFLLRVVTLLSSERLAGGA